MPTLTEPQPTGESTPESNQKPVDTVANGEHAAPIDLRSEDEKEAQKDLQLKRDAMNAQAGTTSAPEGGGFDVSRPPATPATAPADPNKDNPFKLEATEQSDAAAQPDQANPGQPEAGSTEVPVGLGTEQAPAVTAETDTPHVITPDAAAPAPEAPAPAPAEAPVSDAQPTDSTEAQPTPEPAKPHRSLWDKITGKNKG